MLDILVDETGGSEEGLSCIRRVFDRARVILRDDHRIKMNLNPADWTDLKALGFESPARRDRNAGLNRVDFRYVRHHLKKV